MRKTSIYTKGQIHASWVEFMDEISSLKSIKDVKERVQERIRQYTPSGRGRRSTVDFGELQRCVDEAAGKISGTDARTLMGVAAAVWNVTNNTAFMDSVKVRKYVEKNKIKLPIQFVLMPVKKRTKLIEGGE